MIKATLEDKPLVVDILTKSFDTNQSVNYIVPQDSKRVERIKAMMEYAFNVCNAFGEIYLSNDKKACALILLPDKKRLTLNAAIWDAKFALSCIGLSRIKLVLEREAKIKSIHPKEPFYYLWFIGVDPKETNKGVGSKLLKEVIQKGNTYKRAIYLETSTLKNIPWYEKHGFKIFHTLNLSYKLHFLKRDFSN